MTIDLEELTKQIKRILFDRNLAVEIDQIVTEDLMDHLELYAGVWDDCPLPDFDYKIFIIRDKGKQIAQLDGEQWIELARNYFSNFVDFQEKKNFKQHDHPWY